jgi:hypothetical protein
MKKAMRVALDMFLILSLLASCVETSQCGDQTNTSSKTMRAKGEAFNIFLYHTAYRAEHPVSDIESVDKAYLGKVLRFYYESGDLPNVNVSTNTWTWLDPWGVPYNIQIRGTTMPSDEFNVVFGSNCDDIVVWSSGENKINEYGRGDDVLDFNSDRSSRRSSGGCRGRKE